MKIGRGRGKMWLVAFGVLALVTLLGVASAWLIHRSVVNGTDSNIFPFDSQDIPQHEVALVLGARVYPGGQLSLVLKDRVDAAIALYKRGVVKKLLMSGDNRYENYNEVTAMRNYAIKKGVPSDDVVRDFAGFRTYDSIFRAKMLWDIDSMVIVSQEFHLPRSLYIAKKLGVNAVGAKAQDVEYRGMDYTRRREVAARLGAWLDVLVGRDPYFLGPKETLSGDSQRTRIIED